MANLGQLKTVFNFDLSLTQAPVTNFTASTSNPGEIDLSWTLPAVNNLTSFAIQYSTDGGVTWTTLATSTDTTLTSYALTGLDPDQQYLFQLIANDVVGALLPVVIPSLISPKPAHRYIVMDLGLGMYPTSMNNNEDVVGYTNTDIGLTPSVPVVWHNGATAPLILPTPMPGDDGSVNSTTVNDINDSGAIVGIQSLSSPGTDWTVYWANAGATPTYLEVDGYQSLGVGICQISNTSAIATCARLFLGFYPSPLSDVTYPLVPSSTYLNPLMTEGEYLNRNGDYVWNSTQYSADGSSSANFHTLTSGGMLTQLPFSWPVTAFTDTSPYIYVGFDATSIFTGTCHIYDNGTDISLGSNFGLVSINSPTDMTKVQVVGYNTAGSILLEKFIPSGSPPGTVPIWNTNTPPQLADIIPTNSGWSNIAPVKINNNSVIIGTATYSGSNTNIATGSHGLMLLPCQFRLLNGSTNTADVDGMDFSGNRPTTISGTSNYVTSTVIANDIGDTYNLGNDGIDVLGIDTPLGRGRPITDTPFSDNSYLHSLMLLAKVSPAAATNITYGWNRVYQARGVTIAQTSTNTWYVSNVHLRNGIPTPRPDHTNVAAYETVIPSTNNNVVSIYDDPGIYLVGGFGTGAPHTNDYAYIKDAFTYSLTNSIGITNVVATQQVGLFVVAKRTGTSGVVTNDWTGVENVASTTNIPDCSGVTVSEIRAIVYPSTNSIILDPSVTNNF